MVIVADQLDAELAGLSVDFDWGHGSSSPPTARSNDVLVFSLGAAQPRVADIVWLAGAAEPSDAIDANSAPERLIAQAGDGLWRVAPWPVADALFDLEPPGAEAGVLVAGGEKQRREDLRMTLAAGGVPVVARERLVLADLRAAAVVILPSAPEAPLPARAVAVLAAGRLLVTARCRPAFGFQPGIDHLAMATNGEAARLAGAALRFPRAFSSLRAFGRLAAAPHRASLVYRRLLADIALEESAAATAPRRSPAPGG